jgi:hypothetical protein
MSKLFSDFQEAAYARQVKHRVHTKSGGHYGNIGFSGENLWYAMGVNFAHSIHRLSKSSHRDMVDYAPHFRFLSAGLQLSLKAASRQPGSSMKPGFN